MTENRPFPSASHVLDRSSFVPLYYQLQEVLKERIESGVWSPGAQMPSEPELARAFGVSRVVVRQALAILEDDRQITRLRGRGTFVAEPKRDYRAGGLLRLLVARAPDVEIRVLDSGEARPEGTLRERLRLAPGEDVHRMTTLTTVRGLPLAITYSFFRRSDVAWLIERTVKGSHIPADVARGVDLSLAHSELAIETSQCGQFEADTFGVPVRSAVFLVLATEFVRHNQRARPYEVARVEYRGDVLQFQLQTSGESGPEMTAYWATRPPTESSLIR